MTIADLIKYVDFLKDRANTLKQSINRFENTKTITRVVATNDTQKVEEVTFPTVSVKELIAEYDANAKELRLAQTELEKLNHTTVVSFTPKY